MTRCHVSYVALSIGCWGKTDLTSRTIVAVSSGSILVLLPRLYALQCTGVIVVGVSVSRWLRFPLLLLYGFEANPVVLLAQCRHGHDVLVPESVILAPVDCVMNLPLGPAVLVD